MNIHRLTEYTHLWTVCLRLDDNLIITIIYYY